MTSQNSQQPAQVADVGTQLQQSTPEAKAAAAKMLAEEARAKELIVKYGSKSEAIRQLLATGLKIGDVARTLGVKYQHVHNVSKQPQKRKIKEAREAAARAATTEASVTTVPGEEH